MFKSMFQSVVNKISALNPIRHFIKYALDKTLNQFLAKQLTLQDLKNGPLNLNNIQINCEKINRDHLVSSPYILHNGVIGHLKINLPNLSQISTKSIQILVENVQLSLKPNKNFANNFKDKMIELNQLKKFSVEEKEIQGQINENGPTDFFKQLIKNIIMNIKIDVKNIAVRLYMNTPSSDVSKPQYYILLRVPNIELKKKEEKVIQKTSTQQIKFRIQIPQITLHLLRQDTKYPDYGNMSFKQGDFPFNYPTIQHPSTILIIGQSNLNDIKLEKSKRISALNFCLITDYQHKMKELTFSLEVENCQVMVSPVQIKILSRFMIQILEFKKILKKIIEDIKLETGQSINLMKKKSYQNSQANNDFFCSLMISISADLAPQGLNRSRSSQSKDLFQSIIDDNPIMKKDVDKFNKQFADQARKTFKQQSKQYSMQSSIQQFQAINFKVNTYFTAQISQIIIYILKYSPTFDYKRIWASSTQNQNGMINDKICTSYFLLTAHKFHMNQKINEKVLDATLKSINIFNVKLKQSNQSSVDEYYDIGDSVEFYSMNAKVQDVSSFIRTQPDLLQFQIKQSSHYCTEEILKINRDEDIEKKQYANKKYHCMIPKFQNHKSDAYILYKPGFSVHFDQKQNYMKINMQTISISLNMQIIQDILNIVYPVYKYRWISEMINYKREQLNLQKSQNKKNLFQSQYQCRIDMMKMQELQEATKRDIIVLEVTQVKMGFRKGKNPCQFKNLTKKNKQKIHDEDSFSKNCFCGVNDNSCLYAEFYSIQLKKKSTIKLSCKQVQAGLYQLQNSNIKSLSSVFTLCSHRQQEGLRIFKQDFNCTLLSVFVPGIKIKIKPQMLKPIFDMIKDNLNIINDILAYRHYLQNQMANIEHQSAQFNRKIKRNDTNEVQFKIVVDKIFIDCQICLLKAEQIFFTKFTDGLILKASTFVLGLKREVKTKLCEFRNNLMMMSEYPKGGRHQQIPDSDIIIQINDSDRSKISFKSGQKQAYYEKLMNQKSSINFNFYQKQSDRMMPKISNTHTLGSRSSGRKTNKTFSQKFKFSQVSNTIQQEGERLFMNIDITKNINIYLCNGLELLSKKQKIEEIAKFIEKQKKNIDQIKSKTIVMDRRMSTEIQNQSINISIKLCQILVDVNPDFIKKESERILGPTHSILSIDIGQTVVFINKQKNSKQITTSFNLGLYFLYAQDREIQLKPILLKDDLEYIVKNLGYKQILEISRNLIQYKNINDRHIINFKIGNILGQASLTTLGYLQLHFEHVMNHHIKNNLGMSLQQIYEDQQFCNLDADNHEYIDPEQAIIIIDDKDQIMIQDFTQALKQYEEKLNLKTSDERQLKQRVFQPIPISNSMISLESFVLQKMTLRIHYGDDFDFIKMNQLGASTFEKRSRNKQNEQQRFLTINLHGLNIVADIDSSLPATDALRKKKLDIICTYLNLQKIKITMSKQKTNGNCLRQIQDQIQHQAFTILNNENEVCFIVQINPRKIAAKSYSLKLKVGATSQIVTLMKSWKNVGNKIERDGWKKMYQKMKQTKPQSGQQNNKNQVQRILALIPESSIKLSLQYQSLMNILDEQKIVTTQLLLNQQLKDEYNIHKKIKEWVKQLAKDNLGGLISRTALNLLIKLISQIIALNLTYISKFLGLFFSLGE